MARQIATMRATTLRTRRIFARVAAVLKDHNAAITDTVKTRSYLVDLADYDGFAFACETLMDCKELPASTAVGLDRCSVVERGWKSKLSLSFLIAALRCNGVRHRASVVIN